MPVWDNHTERTNNQESNGAESRSTKGIPMLIALIASVLTTFATVDSTTVEKAMAACISVESGGDAKAQGDYEDKKNKLRPKAIGILQIHKEMVDDVNRINGLRGDKARYTYDDRWDVAKSKQMFRTYQSWYAKYYPIAAGKEIEVMARRWNGGPRGELKREKTSEYWRKVKAALTDP